MRGGGLMGAGRVVRAAHGRMRCLHRPGGGGGRLAHAALPLSPPAGTSCRLTPAPTLCSRTGRGRACTMPMARSTWTSQLASRSTHWVSARAAALQGLGLAGRWGGRLQRQAAGCRARTGRQEHPQTLLQRPTAAAARLPPPPTCRPRRPRLAGGGDRAGRPAGPRQQSVPHRAPGAARQLGEGGVGSRLQRGGAHPTAAVCPLPLEPHSCCWRCPCQLRRPHVHPAPSCHQALPTAFALPVFLFSIS